MKNVLLIGCIVFVICSVQGQYKYEWEKKDINSKSSIRGIFAVDDKVVWLGGSGGMVARTIDGGESWELLSIPGGDNLDFRDVHAFNANEAIYMSAGAGQKSKLFKTIDGGQSWTVVHGNTYKEGFFNGMDFWNKKNGVLAGDPIKGFMYIAVKKDGERVLGESRQLK